MKLTFASEAAALSQSATWASDLGAGDGEGDVTTHWFRNDGADLIIPDDDLDDPNVGVSKLIDQGDLNGANMVEVLLAHMVTRLAGASAATAIRTDFGITYTDDDDLHRGAFVGPDNTLCSIPRNETFFTLIDSGGNATTSALGFDFVGLNVSGGALGRNGKFYSPPRDGGYVLVIDTEAGTAEADTFSIADMGLESDKWTGAVQAADGRIFTFPTAAVDFLVIDPDAGTASRETLGLTDGDALIAGGLKWIGGCVGNDGLIYASPFSGASDSQTIQIDHTSDTATVDAYITGEGRFRSGYSGAAMGADGKLYFCPRSAARTTAPTAGLLVFDPTTGVVSTEDYGLDFSTVANPTSGNSDFFRVCAGADGKIYCIPLDATAVLVVDTQTDTAVFTDFGLDMSEEQKWAGAILHVDGKIYCPPKNISEWLVIDTGATLSGGAVRSPVLNKGT